MTLTAQFSAISLNLNNVAFLQTPQTHSLSSRLTAKRAAMHQDSRRSSYDFPEHDRIRGRGGAAFQSRNEDMLRNVLLQPQIIEIPDDESEEDDIPVPPKVRRRIQPPSPARSEYSSAVDLTADEEESDPSSPPRRDRTHQRKRPKYRHLLSAPPLQNRDPQNEKRNTTVCEPQKDDINYPKAQLSFRNGVEDGSRVFLSFRNQPQPAPAFIGLGMSSTAKILADLEKARAEKKAEKARAEKKAENVCPYYYDQKLELRMYRGPGYEQFPVVLGSVAGHKEICDQWDAHEAKKSRLATAVLAAGPLSDPNTASALVSADERPISEPNADEQRCLKEVLQIFPQIQHEFVIEKYRDKLSVLNISRENDMLEFPNSADIVAEIAELASYPFEVTTKEKQLEEQCLDDVNGVTIVWRKDILKNTMYNKEAVILLAREFDSVPTHFIQKTLLEKGALFDTYLYLRDAEDEYFTRRPRPYNRSKQPRVELEKKYQCTSKDVREGHQYVSLVNEMQAAKQAVAREALKVSKKRAKEEEEATNLEIHKLEGSLMECQCCFDAEIPINRAVCCEGEELHFFCFSCVAQLAETQIGKMKGEMRCMHGSGCTAMLATEGVGQAVSIKIFDKLAFNLQQQEISAANIEGLEQCPFCDFKAICDPVEVNSLFSCQNPDCGRATCRKCHEDSHLPRSCEEAKADKGLSARHLVEEARSEAMMRTCPKCKVKIVKELGCNKMRCTTCGCLMCYVCKMDISAGKENGYEHFNRSGAKCKLYDDTGVDRHVVEANEAERAAIQKVKADNEDVDEEKLRVDTKKGDETGIGAAAKKAAKVRPVPGAAPVHQAMMAQFEQLQRNARNMAEQHQRIFNARARARAPPPPPPNPFPPGLGAFDAAPLYNRNRLNIERFRQMQAEAEVQAAQAEALVERGRLELEQQQRAFEHQRQQAALQTRVQAQQQMEMQQREWEWEPELPWHGMQANLPQRAHAAVAGPWGWGAQGAVMVAAEQAGADFDGEGGRVVELDDGVNEDMLGFELEFGGVPDPGLARALGTGWLNG